jgi:hypothetical protein
VREWLPDQVRVALVTGSRELFVYAPVWLALHEQYMIADREGKRLVVRHGDCPKGADAFARSWCEAVKPAVIEQRRPADWDQYKKAAGFRRNTEMVNEVPRPDVCLGFPRGLSNGTRHCMGEARKAGIPVIEL